MRTMTEAVRMSKKWRGLLIAIAVGFVIGYNPKAHKMAEEIEKKANELAQNGYKVLSFSITNSGKAIILADDEGGRDA